MTTKEKKLQLLAPAAAKEISLDAAVALSELDGVFPLKEEQRATLKATEVC